MRITEHLDKISWSLADKVVLFAYGVVSLVQINALDPAVYGLFILLLSLNNWINIITDSFSLSPIIQFGANEQNRPKVNLISLISHVVMSIGLGLLVLLAGPWLAEFFNEPGLRQVGLMLPFLQLLTIPRTYALKMLYRDHRMRAIFAVNLAFYAVMTILTFYLIFTQKMLSFDDMLLIYFAGTVASSVFAVYPIRRNLVFSTAGDITYKKILKFSLPMTAQAVFHYVPRQMLDVFIVQKAFSTSVVGIYGAAKTLFRVFDEGAFAAFSLLYPAAVRQFEKGDRESLQSLLTKSVSLLFFAYLFAVVVLEVGVGQWFISTFLPLRYEMAIGQFEVMILAALALPFVTAAFIITASGHPEVVLKYVLISAVLSAATLGTVGYYRAETLVPLGLVVYYFSLGGLSFLYIKRHFGFPVRHIVRIVSDARSFLLSKIYGNNK
ncbi:MAG: lipopolysaccharide biosynthesis protein [Candidatus Kapaibacterium sp.]